MRPAPPSSRRPWASSSPCPRTPSPASTQPPPRTPNGSPFRSTPPSCAETPSVVHGSGEWTHWPQPRPGLGDTDVGRASQVLHTIEHVGGDVHLGRPTLIRMRAYPVAD